MSARKGRAVARTTDPTRTVQAKQATLARRAERMAKVNARTVEAARS